MPLYSTHPLTLNVDNLFFIFVRTCGKLPTAWRPNHSLSNIIDRWFLPLCHFSANGISLRSGEAEMKKLQRSRQAYFLGAIQQTPFYWIPLLFTACACD